MRQTYLLVVYFLCEIIVPYVWLCKYKISNFAYIYLKINHSLYVYLLVFCIVKAFSIFTVDFLIEGADD